MTDNKAACCTSPTAICYWFAGSLVAWGILGIAGLYCYPLHWQSAATILFAAGIGCIANWRKNRSFHCAITSPLFLLAGLAFLLKDVGVARVNANLLWSLVCIGTCLAFLLEWKYVKRSTASQDS